MAKATSQPFSLPSSTSISPTSTPHPHSTYTSDSEEDTLPYPTELPRKDFLNPSFDPQTYLSSLRNRHQTLEDLRSDLRQRSQLLNQELLDLVNGNYEEFLSLGQDLKGGEERVEGVRVGLLGFRREVEGIQKVVQERRREMGGLLRERKEVRADVVLGRALLEVNEVVGELEVELGITDVEREDGVEDDEFDEDDDADDDAEEDGEESAETKAVSHKLLRRLERHTQKYGLIAAQIARIGPSHPFLLALRPRVAELRKTLLLDLSAALRRAKVAREADAVLRLLRLYALLGAEGDGVRVAKGG